MENYAGPGFGVQNGTLAEAINPDVPVKLIAVDDIGAFVRLAFNDPETFLGKTLEIAGDALTPTQIAEAIARATGRSVRYVHIPIDAVRFRSMPCDSDRCRAPAERDFGPDLRMAHWRRLRSGFPGNAQSASRSDEFRHLA